MHFLTSRNSFPAVLILTLTLLVSAQAELSQEKEESHRFYNTDKTKSFLGVLKSYSPSKKSVGVRLENGRIQFLGIKHLSEEDQAYVLGQSKRLAILNRVRASAEKFSESSTKKEGSGVEERIYPTGYRITVDNGSEETFDQLVVNYTLY